MISPHSVVHNRTVLTADASGGSMNVYVRPDVRYVSLLAQVTILHQGIAADKAVEMSLWEENASAVRQRVESKYLPITVSSTDAITAWSPDPILVSAGQAASADVLPYLNVLCANVNGEDLVVFSHWFNFDKRARELVPLEYLTRVLVRGSTVQP